MQGIALEISIIILNINIIIIIINKYLYYLVLRC